MRLLYFSIKKVATFPLEQKNKIDNHYSTNVSEISM